MQPCRSESVCIFMSVITSLPAYTGQKQNAFKGERKIWELVALRWLLMEKQSDVPKVRCGDKYTCKAGLMDEYTYRSTAEIHNGVSRPG